MALGKDKKTKKKKKIPPYHYRITEVFTGATMYWALAIGHTLDIHLFTPQSGDMVFLEVSFHK